ncbi:MAG TPA: hypothetical protein VNZ64_25800 [Candidatus Acidoferrum sp.]|nr:hypothetical protein [Candidatus Acidoferrum sp.]
MNPTEREAFKEQLSLMAAGRGDGIDLDSPQRWTVAGLRDPATFFRHLDRLIPADSILYFEATNPAKEVTEFYEANRARGGAVCVVRDMIFPVPEIFHVQMRPGLIEELVNLLGKHSQQCCFTHVKAYSEAQLLFAFHDAFDGSSLLVSDRVPAKRVQAFCAGTGATCCREPNQNERDPEVLRRLLWAMENPDQVRILWPWWKKALFLWKK